MSSKTTLGHRLEMHKWMRDTNRDAVATRYARIADRLVEKAEEMRRRAAYVGTGTDTTQQIARRAMHELLWLVPNLDLDDMERELAELDAAEMAITALKFAAQAPAVKPCPDCKGDGSVALEGSLGARRECDACAGQGFVER